MEQEKFNQSAQLMKRNTNKTQDKWCIYGAGAAGCTLAAQLDNKVTVSLIARGNHLIALQQKGLHFTDSKGNDSIHHFFATDSSNDLPPQDIIFLAGKSQQLPEMATNIAPLLHKETIIIPISNGIPWWFFHGTEFEREINLESQLDPCGILHKNIDQDRIIGGLLYMGASITNLGHVINRTQTRLIIGEPNPHKNSRCQPIVNILDKAGFKKPLSNNIRVDIWKKLCWNTAFNPLSVIYQLPNGGLIDDPKIRNRAIAIMQEMQIIAAALNLPLELDINSHIAINERSKNHKPSMLQDFESNKPLETNAIIDAVVHIANCININTPNTTDTQQELHTIIQQKTTPT